MQYKDSLRIQGIENIVQFLEWIMGTRVGSKTKLKLVPGTLIAPELVWCAQKDHRDVITKFGVKGENIVNFAGGEKTPWRIWSVDDPWIEMVANKLQKIKNGRSLRKLWWKTKKKTGYVQDGDGNSHIYIIQVLLEYLGGIWKEEVRVQVWYSSAPVLGPVNTPPFIGIGGWQETDIFWTMNRWLWNDVQYVNMKK